MENSKQLQRTEIFQRLLDFFSGIFLPSAKITAEKRGYPEEYYNSPDFLKNSLAPLANQLIDEGYRAGMKYYHKSTLNRLHTFSNIRVYPDELLEFGENSKESFIQKIKDILWRLLDNPRDVEFLFREDRFPFEDAKNWKDYKPSLECWENIKDVVLKVSIVLGAYENGVEDDHQIYSYPKIKTKWDDVSGIIKPLGFCNGWLLNENGLGLDIWERYLEDGCLVDIDDIYNRVGITFYEFGKLLAKESLKFQMIDRFIGLKSMEKQYHLIINSHWICSDFLKWYLRELEFEDDEDEWIYPIIIERMEPKIKLSKLLTTKEISRRNKKSNAKQTPEQKEELRNWIEDMLKGIKTVE